MVEPSKELENIFHYTVKLAADHQHEYITLEHFLCGLLNDENFTKILKSFGTDVDPFKKNVQNYIKKDLTNIINTQNPHIKWGFFVLLYLLLIYLIFVIK